MQHKDLKFKCCVWDRCVPMSTGAREETTRRFGAAAAGNCESFSVVTGTKLRSSSKQCVFLMTEPLNLPLKYKSRFQLLFSVCWSHTHLLYRCLVSFYFIFHCGGLKNCRAAGLRILMLLIYKATVGLKLWCCKTISKCFSG